MKDFQPSDVELIRTAIRNRLADVRTSIPAIVKSYDVAKQTVECELATRIPTSDGAPEQVPPLQDIPVAWPRGGGYFCAMPLAAGDAGLLVFCEADFTAWRETGTISDPAQERRHGMYGYFIPGGCADGDELTDVVDGKLVIGKQGGPTMTIDGTGLSLGAAVSAFAAKADVIDANISAIKNWLASHTHPVPSFGTSGPAALTPPVTNPTACSKVRIE